MRKKIMRFPRAVINNFQPDGLLFGAQEEYEKTLNLLLSAHQFFDFVDGLKYAEKEFLAKEIKTFSFSDLETFIKGLHERVANNLLLAESGTKAGEYRGAACIHVKCTAFWARFNQHLVRLYANSLVRQSLSTTNKGSRKKRVKMAKICG